MLALPRSSSSFILITRRGGRRREEYIYSTLGHRAFAQLCGAGFKRTRPSSAHPSPLNVVFLGPSARMKSTASSSDDELQLIYEGPYAPVLRTLKRVSLTTCVIGLLSSPFFITLGSSHVPMAANIALTGIVLTATCGPTVLLHAFTKPYIVRLSRQQNLDTGKDLHSTKSHTEDDLESVHLQAETIDFTTRTKRSTIAVADVKPLPKSARPFVSFEAKGSLYFLHGEVFEDKRLLQRLLGRTLKPAEQGEVSGAKSEGPE